MGLVWRPVSCQRNDHQALRQLTRLSQAGETLKAIHQCYEYREEEAVGREENWAGLDSGHLHG